VLEGVEVDSVVVIIWSFAFAYSLFERFVVVRQLLLLLIGGRIIVLHDSCQNPL